MYGARIFVFGLISFCIGAIAIPGVAGPLDHAVQSAILVSQSKAGPDVITDALDEVAHTAPSSSDTTPGFLANPVSEAALILGSGLLCLGFAQSRQARRQKRAKAASPGAPSKERAAADAPPAVQEAANADDKSAELAA